MHDFSSAEVAIVLTGTSPLRDFCMCLQSCEGFNRPKVDIFRCLFFCSPCGSTVWECQFEIQVPKNPSSPISSYFCLKILNAAEDFPLLICKAVDWPKSGSGRGGGELSSGLKFEELKLVEACNKATGVGFPHKQFTGGWLQLLESMAQKRVILSINLVTPEI